MLEAPLMGSLVCSGKIKYSLQILRTEKSSKIFWNNALRDLPISANEYAFGRTKIFIRTSKTVEILEEMRRERIDELAVLIQKTFRGYLCKLKWMRLRDSQIKISNCWKKWKDKSHVTELKQRRQEEWATLVVQKYFRLWQVVIQKRNLFHRAIDTRKFIAET